MLYEHSKNYSNQEKERVSLSLQFSRKVNYGVSPDDIVDCVKIQTGEPSTANK